VPEKSSKPSKSAGEEGESRTDNLLKEPVLQKEDTAKPADTIKELNLGTYGICGGERDKLLTHEENPLKSQGNLQQSWRGGRCKRNSKKGGSS